jgi:hypothetical protein
VRHLQEAVRGDPDNSAYISLLKKCRKLDARKKEGDEAFKTGRYQVSRAPVPVHVPVSEAGSL